MKALFFLILFLPAISHSQDTGEEAVIDMIALHQDEVRMKTGHEVEVIFDPAQRFRATAKIYPTGPVIKFYASMVEQLTPLELVTIACHELGHILGEIRHANIIGGGIRTFREAVEGEADYYAGKCLRNYLEVTGVRKNSVKVAGEIASRTYQKLLQQNAPIQAHLAERTRIIGILPAYPNPECRLLTVLRGIEGSSRPECWYNPE